MNSRQILSRKIGSYQDRNDLHHIKHQTILNKQTESVDNSGSRKLLSNVGVGGINNSLKYRTESNDNLNRSIKKVNRFQSIQRNTRIHSGIFPNLSDLIDQSLKQTDEYRSKIKSSLLQQMSTKHSNETNSLFKFPPKPTVPIELIEKSNENNLNNFISNSNLDKSDDLNTLVGRYEITNSMNPINDFHFYEKVDHFSLNIFEYKEEYSKYFNRLLDEYFHDDIYEHFQSKIICLSLSEQIKEFFKRFSQRYKIIVQLYIQQHLDQSILIASRPLWDTTFDQVLQTKLLKRNIFLFISVFFIYKE